MTRIELSQVDIRDIEDAVDDSSLNGRQPAERLLIRMHR